MEFRVAMLFKWQSLTMLFFYALATIIFELCLSEILCKLRTSYLYIFIHICIDIFLQKFGKKSTKIRSIRTINMYISQAYYYFTIMYLYILMLNYYDRIKLWYIENLTQECHNFLTCYNCDDI